MSHLIDCEYRTATPVQICIRLISPQIGNLVIFPFKDMIVSREEGKGMEVVAVCLG